MTTTEFYSRFHDLTSILKAFAYSLTQNHEDARDLYQETSYRAIKNREKFTPETNFKAWVMTIMKNIFINNYRRKQRHNTMVDTTENLYFINKGERTIRNGGEMQIIMKEVVQMIDALDESLRAPFLLHYQGYKYKEIAERFGLPLGTVKSRIFFARKELKAKIAQRYRVDNAASLLNH